MKIFSLFIYLFIESHFCYITFLSKKYIYIYIYLYIIIDKVKRKFN